MEVLVDLVKELYEQTRHSQERSRPSVFEQILLRRRCCIYLITVKRRVRLEGRTSWRRVWLLTARLCRRLPLFIPLFGPFFDAPTPRMTRVKEGRPLKEFVVVSAGMNPDWNCKD
jgi:hypothetical protein